jgi:hypothetical protein
MQPEPELESEPEPEVPAAVRMPPLQLQRAILTHFYGLVSHGP